MKAINRIISFLTVALMLVTSVPVTTVGAASEDEVYTFYTRAEAAESLYNSGNAQQAVSLLTETEFSGRFGNQLSGFAKKVYDDFVSTYVEEGSATLYTFSKTAETTCSFTLGEEYSFSADIENDSIIYGEDYEPLQAALDTAINYAVFALLYDYPGLFWLKSFKWEYKIMASGNGEDGYRGWFDSVVITPIETFEGASALVTDFCSRIDHFTASTDAHRQSTYGERNDYNYFKSIHDIICMFTEYTTGEDYYLHSSAGVFLYGKGVCEGYAKAFKTLCDVLELPCILVSGGADTDKEEDAPHMWNYIQYEGEWYLVDTTWDDQIELCHTYFMADWDTQGFYEAVRDERRADPDFSGTGTVSFTYPVLHGEHVHEWEKSVTVDKKPSCTEKGSMSIHCASCNETKDVTEIAMTDHKYSVRAGTSATCTEDGEKVYVCDLCETATYTETVPATGHTDEDSDGYCDSCEGEMPVESGYCGEEIFDDYYNVRYSLFNDGTLEIFGNGCLGGNIFNSNENIEKVIIHDGVTKIWGDAFSECDNISFIRIPDSVKSMDAHLNSFADNLPVIHCATDSYAATWAKDNDYPYVLTDGGDEVNIINGIIGTKFTWTLDKRTGILEISGSGDIPSFEGTDAPWKEYIPFVIKVILEEGIEGIGDFNFKEHHNFKELHIPSTLTSIGSGSFLRTELKDVYCPNIEIWLAIDFYYNGYNYDTFNVDNLYFNGILATDIIIPEGVTEIKNAAFAGCDFIESITLPSTLVRIGDMAFFDCDSIKEVNLPSSLMFINESAFSNCDNIKTITIPPKIRSIDGCFSSSSSLEEIIFALDERNQSSIKSISYLYSPIKHMTLPASVESIQGNAFEKSLDSITIYNPECEIAEGRGITFNTVIYGFKGSTAEAFADEIDAVFVDIETVHIHSYKELEENGYCSFSRCVCGKESSFVCIDEDNNFICDTCQKSVNEIETDGTVAIAKYRYLAFKASKDGTYTLKADKDFDGYISVYNEDKSEQLGYSDSNELSFNLTAGQKVYWYVELYDTGFLNFSLSYKGIHCHSYTSQITQELTCIKDRIEIFTCTCGDSYTETVPATGEHKFIAAKGEEPTCTEDGFTEYYCELCEGETYREIIPATGHNYISKVITSATCTKGGYTTYTCTCGYKHTANRTQATGHTYTSKVTTPATCSKAGVRTYTCSCGYSYTKSISKLEHTYKTITAKATLSKNGKVENKCTVCGYVSKTTTVYYPKTIRLSKTSYTYNGKVQTPTVTVKDSKGNTLKKDTDYTVKYESGRKSPGKYTVTVTFKGKYTGAKKLYFTIAPKATSKITASQTTTTITLKWSKVTGADGYRVYKYNTKTKKYEKLKDVTKNTLKISKLKAGTAYKYKVRAFTKDDGTIYGSYSDVFETATKCKTPSIKKLTTTKGKASFTWSDVSGESGYQVYYSTKKDSGYKKVASYKTNAVKGSKTKLKSGKKYYFKIRAYKKTASGTVYSAWSAVRSIKIK